MEDTTEKKPIKTMDEVEHKCFLNDNEIPCRNMTFKVPSFCKPRVVEGISGSTMSCNLGTPQRLTPLSERNHKSERN